MSIARSQLIRGPAVVTWNSINMWTRDDIDIPIAPTLHPVMTSMFGEIDKTKHDLVIKIGLRLWGAWESLSVLFPTAYLNPAVGASIFGNSDLPMTILGRNGDQIVFYNVQLTKMADLRLGVDGDLFSAECEFTCVLANTLIPGAGGAYYDFTSGNSYSDATFGFSKANFKKIRIGGVWTGKTGFGSIVPKDGVKIGWQLGMAPITVDGLGTVDYTLLGLVASAVLIPIGPTPVETETVNPTHADDHGVLLSTSSADLTFSSTGISVVLKNANIVRNGYNFGLEKLRMGEVEWQTTRGFSGGATTAVSTVA